MKGRRGVLPVLMITAALLAGCGCKAEPELGGGLAGHASEHSGTVSTNGATSMEKVILTLAEQYMLDHSNVKVSYDPTGSGTGIEAVKNGTADIGLASRHLKDSERMAGLKETIVALDGIAVIVNAENPVDDLTVEQIAALFTGVADWSAVGDGGKVACIGREGGSGTRSGFETVTKTEDSCVLAQELTSTGAVLEAVRNNPQAIGYASLAAVEAKEGVKMITVNGVVCKEETVRNGTYAIQRPFAFVTQDDVALSDVAQDFFDWAISSDAAELIRMAGAVPVAE